ncbi:MAG: hypothetical protein AAF851_05725 [Myxococcota bacterium]
MVTAVMETRVEVSWPEPEPFQYQFVSWNPPESDQLSFSKAACLSAAFGTGKTLTAAMRFVRYVLQHGRPGDKAIVTAPVSATLEETLPGLLEALLPPAFIRMRRVKSNKTTWTLQNGVRVVFWSGKSYIDSVDAFLIWVDEVQDPLYLDQRRWDRLMGRFRGDHPRKHLIVSGIAVDDETLRGRFDCPDDPNVLTSLPGLEDSWAGKNDPGFIERSLEGKEKRVADAMRKGGWIPPPAGAFPGLNLTLGGNVTDRDVSEYMEGRSPVILCLDPGEQFGVLVAAVIKIPLKGGGFDDGLLGLESMVFDRYGSDQVIEWFQQETDYHFDRLCIDTDAIRDQRRFLRTIVGPSVKILDIPKRSSGWRLVRKLERFRWAICDGHDNRRFLMHRRMMTEGKRGLVNLLRTAKLKPDGTLTKPNDEHVRDAAIYGVNILLEPKAPRKKGEFGTV